MVETEITGQGIDWLVSPASLELEGPLVSSRRWWRRSAVASVLVVVAAVVLLASGDERAVEHPRVGTTTRPVPSPTPARSPRARKQRPDDRPKSSKPRH